MYDIAKTLATNTKISIKRRQRQLREKHKLLNMNGKCEYCEHMPASNSRGGDHYKPLVNNKMPTEYCHEPINIIPVCVQCNSSKQGRDFFVWYTTSAYPKTFPLAVRRRVLKKMRAYDAVFKCEHTRKRILTKDVRALQQDIQSFLRCIDKRLKAIQSKTKFIVV